MPAAFDFSFGRLPKENDGGEIDNRTNKNMKGNLHRQTHFTTISLAR
jgi:hypothetical protein